MKAVAGMVWRYCTAEQCRELLASYRLFGDRDWSREEQERCLYTLSNHAEQYYHAVWIPKKNGKKRKLLIPDPILAEVQKNILARILSEMPVSVHAKAYKKGCGLREMAQEHLGKEMVLRLDIRDFFGNITYIMVYQQVFSGLRFPPAIGTLLTHLCCYRDLLPQGAPTSPAISNLVMKPFDEYMGRWCKEQGIAYSRYCDDLVFSGTFDPKSVKNKAAGFLRTMGFLLNEEKTSVCSGFQRQTVTGLVVNEKLQVSREYRRMVHQDVYYCCRFGVENHLKQRGEVKPDWERQQRYLLSLTGRVNYILQINPRDGRARSDLAALKALMAARGENAV